MAFETLRRLPGASGALALLAISNPTQAHAPPLASRILFDSAGDASVYVTNRGLIFDGQPTGAPRLLCNEALGINSSETPKVVRVGEGHLLIASTAGLFETRDEGCTLTPVGDFGGQLASALASDPANALRSFVAIYDSERGGVYETHDGALTWRLAYQTSPEDFVTSLLVSPADSETIYATATRYGEGSEPSFFLLHSSDGGESWNPNPLTLLATDYAVNVLAGSAADPTVLMLGTVALQPGRDPGRLLVSRDAGVTAETVLEARDLIGASFGPGGDAWAASRQGLHHSGPDLERFEVRSDAAHLGCVLALADELWVCGHFQGEAVGRTGAGLSVDQGRHFAATLDFTDVDRPVACSVDSPATTRCITPWLDWETELLVNPSPNPGDAGPQPDVDEPRAAAAEAPSPSDDSVGETETREAESTLPHASGKPSASCSFGVETRGGVLQAWWLAALAALVCRRR